MDKLENLEKLLLKILSSGLVFSTKSGYEFFHREIAIFLAAKFYAENYNSSTCGEMNIAEHINSLIPDMHNTIFPRQTIQSQRDLGIESVSYGEYLFRHITETCDKNVETQSAIGIWSDNEKTAILRLGALVGEIRGYNVYEEIKPFMDWYLATGARSVDMQLISYMNGMLYTILPQNIGTKEKKEAVLEEVIQYYEKICQLLDSPGNKTALTDLRASIDGNIGATYLQLAHMNNNSRLAVRKYIGLAKQYHKYAVDRRKKIVEKTNDKVNLIRSYICLATDCYYEGVYIGENSYSQSICDAIGHYDSALKCMENEREKKSDGSEAFVIYTRMAGCHFKLWQLNYCNKDERKKNCDDLKACVINAVTDLKNTDVNIGREHMLLKYDRDIKNLINDIDKYVSQIGEETFADIVDSLTFIGELKDSVI